MFYCPRIKNGLVFTPNGDYDVCASRNLAYTSKQNVNEVSPQEFLKSDFRKKLLETMDKGQWPKGCEKCQWMEALRLPSVRQNVLESSTKRIHVHATNVCDSDCVMCGPRWSTTIQKRLVKNPDPTESFFFKGSEAQHLWDDAKSVEHLESIIDQYDELHFVGGEPFLDKKLWKFLKKNKNKNIKISFVTNGNTALSKSNLKILSEYKTVNAAISIDGTDLTYEWIRQNLSWNKLIKNVVKMKHQGINVVFVSVIQAHNILNIPKLDDFASKTNITIHYDVLTSPSVLNPTNAPRWVLEQAYNNLKASSTLKQYYELFLNSSPICSLDDLIKHTKYLNGHRTLQFDTETWQVQKRCCTEPINH